jgi:hypothetical protein
VLVLFTSHSGAMRDNAGMKNLLPKAAWALLQEQPDALFVDVRMEIESLYVGRPPGVHIIAWSNTLN